ncbi:MAG: type VI secretion system tube protein Hcp [Blastocatellia bacterium]|nr:MAG: type VI secretion system tube protein Hcp [Blastocatellia bacterium]
MAKDYFLKLDSIKGESTDAKHKGEIEVESFSWGATNPHDRSSRAGGLGAGRVQFQDLHVTKLVDSASPLLALACAAGDHIKEANLTVRKQGGEQQEYLKIKLTDVLISSYQSGGSEGSHSVPVDQFSLNFAKILFEYYPQDTKGKLGSPFKAGWDLSANKKV